MIILYNPKNRQYARKNRHQYFMTEAEWKMWNLWLRRNITWYRFLRQKPLWNYIVDFYCDRLKLWIEIDWESHNWQWMYDEIRTIFLKKLWIKIIRYTNNQVHYQLDWVLIDLNNQIEERYQELGLMGKIPVCRRQAPPDF